MAKKEDLSERMAKLLNHYGLNPNELAKKIGGARTKAYNVISGKTKPQWDTMESILETFPEISAEWLVRGEGSMLKANNVSIEEVEKLKGENLALQALYRSEIEKTIQGKKSEGMIKTPGIIKRVPFNNTKGYTLIVSDRALNAKSIRNISRLN
jgi:DNA-binding XRE family transcriptional regulator